MIKSFEHKGLEAFFRNGSKAGIQPHHANRLRLQLTVLDKAKESKDMSVLGWRLHGLTGDLAGFFSVDVNGNWRMTFRFDNGDVVLVDYQDYH